MFDKIRNIDIEISTTKIAAIWEEGGSFGDSGVATLVCDNYGQSKNTISKKYGKFAEPNGKHALIPISLGDYVVEVDHIRQKFNIALYKITKINKKTKLATIELVASCERENCYGTFDDNFKTVIKIAKEKATNYKCTKPYFIYN